MKTKNLDVAGRCAMIVVAFLVLGTGWSDRGQGDVPQISRTINDFTLALLKRLAADGKGSGNMVLSAQSVFHGLAMSYIASGGDTRAEFARVCGFPDDNQRLLTELAVT